MRIITISRELGSGGRELGKRLADYLRYSYYDREIITTVAKQQGMDEGFVEKKLNSGFHNSFAFTFRNSFSGVYSSQNTSAHLLVAEKKVVLSIAEKGEDCVIVGRNADVILKQYNPYNIFVYADMQAKILRCQQRANPSEKLSEKEIEKNIKYIDQQREKTREIITDSKWGDKQNYHLTVNTTGLEIKELVPAISELAGCWFRR